jgi:hypothetical protein
MALALCATIVLLAQPAAALGLKLTIERAGDRSADFAARTCDRDEHCIAHGVLNCHRQGRHVVLCRIFDDRRTEVQGRYRCSRLIRLSLDPRSRRVPVTGLGHWQC